MMSYSDASLREKLPLIVDDDEFHVEVFVMVTDTSFTTRWRFFLLFSHISSRQQQQITKLEIFSSINNWQIVNKFAIDLDNRVYWFQEKTFNRLFAIVQVEGEK